MEDNGHQYPDLLRSCPHIRRSTGARPHGTHSSRPLQSDPRNSFHLFQAETFQSLPGLPLIPTQFLIGFCWTVVVTCVITAIVGIVDVEVFEGHCARLGNLGGRMAS